MPPRLELFATAARGTEPFLVQELEELGATRVRRDRGGVRFAANLNEALRICLWTRIAMRVLYPLGEATVQGADGLYDAARSIPWQDHLTADSTFAVDSSLRDSEHTHSGFVSLKVKDAIVDTLRERFGARPNVDTKNPQVRVVAHLAKDHLSLSLDLCGDALNRRGYRVQPTTAPLKETLAAAILKAAGYTGEEPLLDPMCGSGTFILEAGLIAARKAPNLRRTFAVETWPHLGKSARRTLDDLRLEARAQERTPPAPLLGFDKDEEVVTAARANAKAAGLGAFNRIDVGDATKLPPLPVDGPGLLVTNPPYGDRLTGGVGQKGMKTFYYQLGESFRRLDGWRAFILCGNPAFESAFHQKPKGQRPLWNGPIECRLLEYGFGAAKGAPTAPSR
jgi:putative N6-adenine-specific DNA methylase